MRQERKASASLFCRNNRVSWQSLWLQSTINAAHLAFKINCCGADQVALIVGLLHRRRCLVPHHDRYCRWLRRPWIRIREQSEWRVLVVGWVSSLPGLDQMTSFLPRRCWASKTFSSSKRRNTRILSCQWQVIKGKVCTCTKNWRIECFTTGPLYGFTSEDTRLLSNEFQVYCTLPIQVVAVTKQYGPRHKVNDNVYSVVKLLLRIWTGYIHSQMTFVEDRRTFPSVTLDVEVYFM